MSCILWILVSLGHTVHQSPWEGGLYTIEILVLRFHFLNGDSLRGERITLIFFFSKDSESSISPMNLRRHKTMVLRFLFVVFPCPFFILQKTLDCFHNDILDFSVSGFGVAEVTKRFGVIYKLTKTHYGVLGGLYCSPSFFCPIAIALHLKSPFNG